MIAELIDGSICTDLYTEDEEREWHMVQREGGSVSLYYTYRNSSGLHYVVWDSLDNKPPSAYVQAQLERVAKLHHATGALLAAVSLPNQSEETQVRYAALVACWKRQPRYYDDCDPGQNDLYYAWCAEMDTLVENTP